MQPILLNLSPAQLQANTFNTNIVSPENETRLDASLSRNGMFKPVIVREITTESGTAYEIIGGEHRWESAKRLGMAEIPVVNLGAISDEKAKEISVIDNARYGADDTLLFAELLKGLGDIDDLQNFLPFATEDLTSIFSSVDIALEDLDIDDDIEKTSEPEPPAATAPKTHQVMRFKVSLRDAEQLTRLIAKTRKQHDFNSADELTNAGDAIVHLLVGQFVQPAAEDVEDIDLDDLNILEDLDES